MRLSDTVHGGGSAPTSAPDVSPSSLSAAVLRGCVGDFYRAVEGVSPTLTDAELPLPQLVVVGHERSGKSSVLESLAMLPLLPRHGELCTRFPIHLKLRHVPQSDVVDGDPELMPHRGPGESSQLQIHLRFVYSDGREPVESDRNFTPEQAVQWMQQIVKEESEKTKLIGVADHVLEIQVRSPHVPNLNLIDLPGIVAGTRKAEPEDMMQRTRALAEKYLQMPHTLVLAVVPAFERVRNSQALQLVQQYKLMDQTIGVLTMVDRAQDATNPDGPLAEVMRRLDGTSGDIVELKQGYVAVKNRDTRVMPERSLDKCKREEKTWLQENLPGYTERNLASSSVLVTKIEKMLADHVRTSWVPQTLTHVKNKRIKIKTELANLGPSGQEIVDGFLKDSFPKAGRQRMLQLMRPIVPRMLSSVDAEILQLVTQIHGDFIRSRDEHELLLAPLIGKKKISSGVGSGSLMVASLLVLDSLRSYMTSHLSKILKNIALHVVSLIQKTIATSLEAGKDDYMPLHIERFANLHNFFASVLWERLNELMIDEEDLLERLEKSFLEFDPVNAQVLHIPMHIKTNTSPKAAGEMKTLADNVEIYLNSKGFQNTELDELYLPPVEALTKGWLGLNWYTEQSLDSDVARMIIGAKVPTITAVKSMEGGSGEPSRSPYSAPFGGPPPGFGAGTGYWDRITPRVAPVADFGCSMPAVAPARTPSLFGERPRETPSFSFGTPVSGRQSGDSNGGFGAYSRAGKTPKAELKLGKSEYQDVGEFEARLFFALTSHVVAPLLQPICDVGELDRKMKDYVSRYPTVSASRAHIFWESTFGERQKLAKLVEHLDAARLRLQSMSSQ